VKRERSRQRGKDGLDLIEEAIHLLRSAPSAHLAVYYTGTLPFVLTALYFWGEMSRSPFAGQHLAAGALTLACLFVWMKACQAIFSRQMRCSVSGECPRFGRARIARIFLSQAALQPTGLFLLPLALVPLLPFPWVFAFYQNLSALDDGETTHLRELVRKASSQALLWPRQNHLVLAILSAFGLFVCLNLMTVCFILPGLVKMLFGVETVFTRSGVSLINTTFFAAMLGLAYLCIDPILKTIYTLRCFYGQSQRSGADLQAELRQVVTRLTAIMSAIVLLGLGVQGTNLCAGEQPELNPTTPTAPSSPHLQTLTSSVPATELDRTIQDVIRQPKYAWRQPRNKILETEKAGSGFFGRLLERVESFLKNSLKDIGRWLDGVFRRLFSQQRPASSGSAEYRWVMLLRLLLYALIAATAVGLIWLCYRVWKSRHQNSGIITSEPLRPVPDLGDENLGADQLPEDSWISLAHKLLADGELRLALRAFYLASLARLAARNLIHLARFKSNWDYERELRRRAHALPSVLSAFRENLPVFDRIWYGMHEINGDVVNRFAANVERMRLAETKPTPPPEPR
jgi:hypothetical protein